MPTPSPSWDTVRVFGTWHDHRGSKRAGEYKVTVPERVVNTTDNVIVPAGSWTGSLQTSNSSAPSFDERIPANNDPDNQPSGWQVILEVTFADKTREVYYLDLPVGSADVDLSDVAPTYTPPAGTTVNVLKVPGNYVDGDFLISNGSGGLAWQRPTSVEGLAFINHGNNPNVARPDAVMVIWAGTVEPVNAQLDQYDLWSGPIEGA